MIGVFNSKCNVQYALDKDKWGSVVLSEPFIVDCNVYSKSNYKRGSYKESITYNKVIILNDKNISLESIIDGHKVIEIEVVYDIEGDYLYTICCI